MIQSISDQVGNSPTHSKYRDSAESDTKHAVIEQIILHTITAPVALKYGNFETNYLSAMIIEVRSSGCSGWGECSAKPWRFFDAYTSAIRMGRRLLGRPALEPSRSLRFNPSRSLEFDIWSFGYNKNLLRIREGFSIALYDLAARLKEESVVSMLGGPARTAIPGMPVIHCNEPEKMAAIAQLWVKRFGYNYLKIKLGADHNTSVRRLEAIRNAVGFSTKFQVDFNYAFLHDAEAAVKSINELHRLFEVEVAEDPVKPRLELYPYPWIKRNLHTNLMMDGAAYWPNVMRLARSNAANIFNHHTDGTGGIDLVMLMGSYVRKHGILNSIGSSGLVGIQDCAFQTLSSVTGLERPCESIGFYHYAHEAFEGFYGVSPDVDLLNRGPNSGNGLVTVDSAAHGFGGTPDLERLKSLASRDPILISH